MQDVYQPIYSLVNEIKGITKIISSLISRKSGVLFLFGVIGIVASKIFMG